MEEQQNEKDNWRTCCFVFVSGCCHLSICEELMGTSTVECWGCHKYETNPIVHGEEFEKQRVDMASRGWRRKAFWPADHPIMGWDKGPWFCSDECATNSYNAKQAEEYWRHEEFVEYCRKNEPSTLTIFAIIIGAGVVVSLLGLLLGGC